MFNLKKNCKAILAISLSSNPELITACASDMGFKMIFKRLVEALVNKNDCIIYISTSGNNENIIEAAKYTKNKNIYSIALTGNKGGQLAKFCNQSCMVRSNSVARIQEAHIFLLIIF